ncbi:MAG: hypothetical protein LQ338_006152 [Usnochroma carphineum]|nr:MAG: hypothetical protein LQ338_006152 [Usnochroma carphineum]
MSTSPLPTRLIFLSDLPSLSEGEKVRFLGCVTAYSTLTGVLTLQHAYPSVPGKSCPAAGVDVNLLHSTLKSTDTQVGEWVNVIGYVQDFEGGSGGNGGGKGKRGRGEKVGRVQAVMLWSADGVKLGEYEKTVEMRKRVEGEKS